MQTATHEIDPGLEFEPEITSVRTAVPVIGLSDAGEAHAARAWAVDAVARGVSRREAEKHLVTGGWSPSEAAALVAVVQRPTTGMLDTAHLLASEYDATHQPGSGAYAKSMNGDEIIAGGKWLIGGIALTIGSYALTSVHGGVYFLLYGAILFGAIRVIRGLSA
jgi:hypothetical protein